MSNTNSVEKNNDTKKITALIILIVTVMVTTTSATYAFFQLSATNNTTMTGTAATASLTLTVTRETPGPSSTKWTNSTKVMVPQLSAALGTAMNATNQCVDGNNNVVCEVFKIIITNGSTASARLRGAIYFTGGTFNNLYWRQTTNANTVGNNTIYKASIPAGSTPAQITAAEQANSTTAEAVNATLVGDVLLTPSGTSGAEQTYYVAVWIKETGSNQNTTDVGTWTATVSFKDKVNAERGITSTITS